MIIASRFNGPPTSGNGGYTAGAMAAELGDPARAGAEITLRRPPPLDRRLDLRPMPDGGLGAFAGDELVVSGRPVAVDEEPVAPVSLAEATRVALTYPGFAAHPFPTCYVCGPERADGLRVFPGRFGAAHTAAPFLAPADISAAVLWAALDCPGGWAIQLEDRPHVLGRIAARIDALPAPGTRCVAVGQLLATEDRKAHVRTSVYTADGALLATARATWIALTPADIAAFKA